MFEWDDAKSTANLAKHGISFAEASLIFDGPVLSRTDDRRDYGEVRTMSVGRLRDVLVVVVIPTERSGTTRIISARWRADGNGDVSMPISDDRLTALRTRADQPDAAIDFSDIPELEDAFFETATLVEPDRTEHVTLRVKKSVVDAYRRLGKGHTSRMSLVLETYAKAKLR